MADCSTSTSSSSSIASADNGHEDGATQCVTLGDGEPLEVGTQLPCRWRDSNYRTWLALVVLAAASLVRARSHQWCAADMAEVIERKANENGQWTYYVHYLECT